MPQSQRDGQEGVSPPSAPGRRESRGHAVAGHTPSACPRRARVFSGQACGVVKRCRMPESDEEFTPERRVAVHALAQ